jgi:diadenosine tetraphosphatase ApaH/serine/threonine PP2A family protein phosphatase
LLERTIVVGDVHGCIDELRDLLRTVGYGRGDRLVLVGDLVAKGPDSQGVVQLAREAGALAVLGNHDEHALRARTEAAEGREIKPERRQVVDTLTDADWRFLEGLPLFLRLGEERPGGPQVAVVHAGAVPGIPLEEQDRDHLLTLRSITASRAPSKRIEETPWAALWNGPEFLVFGHDAVRGLQEHPMATGLDTGCVYGGRLTALLIPERRLVSVRACRAYV